MAFPNYVSCMKIAGYPLLPPLMTERRRQECCRDKLAAIELEQKLNNRRNCEVSQNVSISEKSLQDADESNVSSTDNREKLIDFVKSVLQDVLHTEEGQNLQDQIMEELGKLELNRDGDDHSKAGSSNTLDNLDNFSFDEKSANTEALFNFHEMERNLPPVQSCEISPAPATPEPPKLVRRNSYTLESPSQCVITYLKSLTKQEGVESWEPNKPKVRSVSKNLNNFWGESSTSRFNGSPNKLGPTEIPVHSSQQTVNLEYDIVKNNNYTVHNSYRMPLGNANHLMNQDEKLMLQHRAAAKIQAGVRGYLVRRLMKTNKVIELKATIKDSLIYALSLHAEQTVSPADINLHVGLIRQVTAACYEVHSIFFEWSVKDKMHLISQDRLKLRTQKVPRLTPVKSPRKFLKRRSSSTSSQSSMSTSASFHKNSVRSSPYSLSKSSSASALKYQPWL